MQSRLTADNSSRRLLMLFCGWGTDSSIADNLSFSGYDTLAVWDYRDTLTLGHRLDRYEEIVVAAWSFGVAAAAHFLAENPHLPVTRRVAINGTLHPVSDTHGIPAAIFRGTLDGLCERSLTKFYRRMADGRHFTQPCRPIDELADELRAIEALNVPPTRWDLAYISQDDRIIPAANQQRAWQGTPARQLEGGHLPDFQTILAPLLIDKDLVARRFAKAAATYDSAATVQRLIAERLLSLASLDPTDTIEIGSGTGLLTRMFLEQYTPGRLTLVDFNPAPVGNAVTIAADAELWMASAPSESASCIISASTMQWFNSPGLFLDNVRRILRPGGTALISTFGRNNMKELAGLAPSLPYPAADELPDVVADEEIRLEFPTAAEALRHMRLTGVNAVSQTISAADVLRLTRRWPRTPHGSYTLTYNPLYIKISK